VPEDESTIDEPREGDVTFESHDEGSVPVPKGRPMRAPRDLLGLSLAVLVGVLVAAGGIATTSPNQLVSRHTAPGPRVSASSGSVTVQHPTTTMLTEPPRSETSTNSSTISSVPLISEATTYTGRGSPSSSGTSTAIPTTTEATIVQSPTVPTTTAVPILNNPPPKTHQGPISAWYAANGRTLVELTNDDTALNSAIITYTTDLASHPGKNHHKQASADLSAVASNATILEADVEQARRISPIPNPMIQSTWKSVLADLGQASSDVKDGGALTFSETALAQGSAELETANFLLEFASGFDL